VERPAVNGPGLVPAGSAASGRLDRLGPAAGWARALAGPVRAAGGTASAAVRRALREPAALRDAERTRLISAAEAALATAGGGAKASDALEAALTAWLADPDLLTGALLTEAQGRYRADPGLPVPLGLVDLPLDEAQLLAAGLRRPDRPGHVGGRPR
jgi:hypothetical protein